MKYHVKWLTFGVSAHIEKQVVTEELLGRLIENLTSTRCIVLQVEPIA